MARSIECECTNSYTCGYCLRNAKPWLWTPSNVVEVRNMNGIVVQRYTVPPSYVSRKGD